MSQEALSFSFLFYLQEKVNQELEFDEYIKWIDRPIFALYTTQIIEATKELITIFTSFSSTEQAGIIAVILFLLYTFYDLTTGLLRGELEISNADFDDDHFRRSWDDTYESPAQLSSYNRIYNDD